MHISNGGFEFINLYMSIIIFLYYFVHIHFHFVCLLRNNYNWFYFSLLFLYHRFVVCSRLRTNTKLHEIYLVYSAISCQNPIFGHFPFLLVNALQNGCGVVHSIEGDTCMYNTPFKMWVGIFIYIYIYRYIHMYCMYYVYVYTFNGVFVL